MVACKCQSVVALTYSCSPLVPSLPYRSLGFETQYFQTAQHLYDLVLAANDKGEHVPLWGTCMGFQVRLSVCVCMELTALSLPPTLTPSGLQLLNIITAHNQSVLDRGAFNSEDLPLALDFSA